MQTVLTGPQPPSLKKQAPCASRQVHAGAHERTHTHTHTLGLTVEIPLTANRTELNQPTFKIPFSLLFILFSLWVLRYSSLAEASFCGFPSIFPGLITGTQPPFPGSLGTAGGERYHVFPPPQGCIRINELVSETCSLQGAHRELSSGGGAGTETLRNSPDVRELETSAFEPRTQKLEQRAKTPRGLLCCHRNAADPRPPPWIPPQPLGQRTPFSPRGGGAACVCIFWLGSGAGRPEGSFSRAHEETNAFGL